MRRRWLAVVVMAAACGVAGAATPVWVTPDVPTDEALNGTTLFPDTIYRYDGASYTPVLTVPGGVDLNAIHKMDRFGDWLFSIEAPSDLGGALLPLGTIAEARDLIRFDASVGTFTICMSGAAAGIPPGTNVDAVYMDPGDDGDIIVSFDVPTDVGPFAGPTAFEPADLVRFAPAAIGVCAGPYAVVAANPELDATLTAPPIPIETNVDGAEDPHLKWVLALDVPTDLPPVYPPTAPAIPGELVLWDGAVGAFSSFETLTGWPITGVVDGVSCGGSAGRVPDTSLKLNKAAAPNLTATWAASCLPDGGQDYAIYEGTIGSYYSHTTAIVCTDAPPTLAETFAPGAGSHYYLVVPLNACKGTSEGSYGRCSTGWCGVGDERPVNTTVCAAFQRLPFAGDPACP